MHTTPLTLPLRQALDLSQVGGKAINLCQLMQAGLPVPNGFVVTTAAYRAAGSGASMTPDIEAAIQSAYEELDEATVAVRSSATAEDMAGASMAGQYDTFLDVQGIDAVLEAVEKCWQSLQAERVQTYLQEHAIDPKDVAVAVVVQILIPAEVSGVLFTVNPRTANEEEMVVEAVYGLGEGIVSGEVHPDVYHMQAHNGTVLNVQVAEKTQALYPGNHDYQPVPEEKIRKACLNHVHLQELLLLGHRAQTHFGGAQDMEWALANDKVYVLQARAITTLLETRAYHQLLETTRDDLRNEIAAERGPWVQHNLSETLPLPTPLTWSLIEDFMSGRGGFGRMHEEVGFAPSDQVCQEGFLQLIAGQIYMDCSRMPEMFCQDYPFAYDMEILRDDPDAAQQPPSVPKGGYQQQAKAAQLGLKVTEAIRKLAKTLDTEFDNEFVPQVKAWCTSQNDLDLSSLSDSELIDLWKSQQNQVFNDFGKTAFLPSMVEALAAADLKAFLEEHIWDYDAETLLQELSVSPRMDVTLQSNIELQEVAQGQRALETWLNDHGYRGPGEFDLAEPRWQERPEAVEELAHQMKDSGSLAERHATRQQEAKDCLTKLTQSLSPDLASQLTEHAQLLQRYVRFREDGKAIFMLAFVSLRQTILEMARRLDIEDRIFFLTQAEMIQALGQGFVPEDRIVERRAQHQAAKQFTLPHVIEANDIENLGQAPVREDGDTWSAHAVSHGTCTGTACIVLDPTEADNLGENYILVCPSTDPAWTPLFVKAAGLILERGGGLSHGAIVAREMGLPAVVLANATNLLKSGETVTVDANHGRVFRGQDTVQQDESNDTWVSPERIPPSPGTKERQANQYGLLAALAWGLFLGLTYLLPASLLKDPVFTLIDALLWPFVASIGMIGTVSLVGAFFAVVPLLIQRWVTDNDRLWEAKKRGAALQKDAARFSKDSPRHQTMLAHAAPITMRTLKASMTGLAWVLGPMMLVFLWMPERMDPAAWNADSGGLINVVAEISGEHSESVTLNVPDSLQLEQATPAEQSLPPIRQTLEEIRQELKSPSDMDAFPWELQSAGDQAREIMLSSLNAYLATGIPPQKLTWIIRVPETVQGHVPLKLLTADSNHDLTLAFGNKKPPTASKITHESGPIISLEAIYPRALKQRQFWTPLKMIGGPAWDFGWLGVYILVYLVIMVITKRWLRVA